ncbi:D-ribitol-5-phosphate cytidylyltransferase isoform X1 [Pangasianodon hypophthalmus]|uniref:D-ribitol-5-phosphate cytidylyltransferase isoform X1 n=1 Tax=Pangasianodon hypophthalmus TaxID=310915 RepID=UPI000F001585|nr:D-ribitol-5-phosphate cytidylyltransferase isoform X1 [Pangasianodon hypophthalmus]XP_053095530.1 D-ribitol-5-phosphate cytidylyltransferase isoform X1 [Pangasianodon hypophthalmus]
MMGSDAVDFPVAVVLPAAGCGERTGLATPKQFCTFLNRPLISFTIETFERIPWIESIVVVVAKESHDLMLHIIHQFHHTKVKVVEGGTTRHRSIFKGLQAFSESTEGPVLPRPKVVIIHDAVRPFVDEDFLLKITLAAKEQGASGAIRPLVSTVIATTSEGFLDHSLERTKYRASEMPQGFLYDVIYQAYQRCSEFDFEFGTECLHLALQYSGTSAKLIEGPPTLWKVTYKRDLAAAESIIKETLSLSACLISGAMAETVELSSRLQKNLESHHMAVDVIACTKENNELLLKTRNFIQISTSGASLSETEEMVKVFEETKHALLYPVVIVLVHLHKSDEASDIQKNDELTALMDLSMKVKQGNILLYSVRIIYSKVPELWERSVARLSEITESLIRDRNPVLTGQMLRA